MTVLAQHVAALLIDYAGEFEGGEVSTFQGELFNRLASRWSVRVPSVLLDDAVQILVDIGGCEILKSDLTADYCRITKSGSSYYFRERQDDDVTAFGTYEANHKRVVSQYPILRTYFLADRDWVEAIAKAMKEIDLQAETSQSEIPEPLVDSTSWTGRKYVVSDGDRERVREIVLEIEAEIDHAGLPNSEVVRIKALTAAVRELLVPADPEWSLIIRILSSPVFATITALAALAVEIIKG